MGQSMPTITIRLTPEMAQIIGDNSRFVFTGQYIPTISVDSSLPIEINYDNGIVVVSG